ncbi:MAG: restriction endonuclease subunit S [Clostridium sp.]
MREMKDSCVSWIGTVPSDWIRKKVKNAVSLIGSGTTPASSCLQYYESEDVNWIQSGDIYGIDTIIKTNTMISNAAVRSLSALHVYNPDFIVVAMYGGSVGNIAISKIEACVNQACCCIRTDNQNDLKFMYYWIYMCKSDFLRVSEGGGQPNISQAKIRNQYYMQPPLAEQRRIADFLDTKCAEIDALTADIQTQIDTLEQYKRSVITEAVTKGVNPDAEMKDSGIEWIGEIPATWNIIRGKYLLKYLQKPVKEDDGVITCFRDGEVTLRSNRREDGFTMSDKEIGYQGIDVGDLVVHGMDGFAGAIGISDSRGKASPVLNVMDTKQNKRYIMYYLRSMAYSDVFVALATGIRVRSCDLRWNKLADLPYPVPNIEEQIAIVEYIDATLEKTDAVITEKKSQIETLDEYKKSLIYEYVTGKKEVPSL